MLEEPASAITDFALGFVALVAFVGLERDGRAHPHWRRAFALIAIAGVLGGIHHGFVVRHDSFADVSWAIISTIVVVALSFILAASAATVLGEGRGRILMAIRYVSLLAFVIVAILGHATVTTLVITEALAMAMVLGLWIQAWRLGQPGVGMFFAAIAASAVAGAVKGVTPEVVVGGWVLDPDTFYHLAQLPGLAVLYVAILRRADATALQIQPQRSTLAAEA